MGCCSGNKVGDAKASTDGPDHPMKLGRRGCTDCLCLILFVIFWAGMAFIAYLGVTFGDANALVYGQDYMANRCGVGAYADRPKVYYPRIDEDMIAQSVIVSSGQLWRVKLYGLCLAECPTVSSPQQCVDNPTSCIIEDYGTAEQGSKADAVGWFATLPTRDVLNRCIPTKHSEAYGGPERCVWPACDNVTNTWMTCDPEFPNTWLVAEAPFYKQGECEVKMSMMTTVVLQDTSTSVLTEQIAEHMTAVSRVAESLWESRWYILAFGVGLPIVMGMIWVILLRLFAKTIVYCMIVLMGILLIATTLYLFWASDVFPEVNEFLDNTTAVEMGSGTLGSLGDSASSLLGDAADTANSTLTAIVRLVPDELDQQIAAASVSGDMKTMMQIASWVMLIITLIYIIVICISRRKIVICVTVVKEATKAVKAQPLMMVFPLWMMTAQAALLVFVLFIFAFLANAELTVDSFTDPLMRPVESSSYSEYMEYYNATAGEGAAYFQSLDATAGQVKAVTVLYFFFGFLWTSQVLLALNGMIIAGAVCSWYWRVSINLPITKAATRTLLSHIGTVCFGSFIIALVKFVRYVLMAIQTQADKVKDKKVGMILKLALCCVSCCLYCLEKTLKYITNFAYIYTAMQGSGFCGSCKDVFKLLLGHMGQMAINAFVQRLLHAIQSWGIPFLSGWVAYEVLGILGVGTRMYAVALIFLMSVFFSRMFASVFETTIDCIFVCAFRDEDDYDARVMAQHHPSLKSALAPNVKSQYSTSTDQKSLVKE